ncbi:ABC transporter permease [soil metagenome]
MIRNYLTVALRNILKYKFFSAINIFGMTVGITSCLLIFLFVSNEISYEQFQVDGDRIYQVGLHGKMGGQDIRVANTCPPMAAALVLDVPEIESATRINDMGGPVVKVGDKAITEENVFLVDSNFFQFFSYKLLQGDPKTVLKDINTVVLTVDMAKKYFGEENAIGKIIVLGDREKAYKVTGIAANAPVNSHINYNILVSSESSDRMGPDQPWLNNFMYTYLKLQSNTTAASVESKFPAMVEKYVGPEVERFMGTTLKQMKETGGAYGYYTTNIKDIHLYSTSQGDIEAGGNIMYVYFFAGVGIFIMIIACINFMNLSTAQSAGRAKEVGLRKTLGSLRGQMIFQFLAESMLYSFVAVVLAVAACYVLLPQFNILSGKELGMDVLTTSSFLTTIIVLMIVVGLVAGSYPAFYLTSFAPVEVLKGKARAGLKSKGIRSVLVVFQFMLSIFLIIFTVVVFQQINYLQEKNLGIDKNNILMIENGNRLEKNKEAFRNALLQQTGVVNVSYSNNTFPGVNNTTVIRAVGAEQDHIIGVYYADYEHQDVMKFELSEGRYFSRDFPSDSTVVVINEAAAREFGFENPIGSEILYNENGNKQEKYKVIGVIRNFNFESFKENVRPLCLFLTKNANNLMIRYEGSSTDLVKNVEQLWKQHSTNDPFEYSFLDENFDKLFRTEQRMGQLLSIFSGLTIFIACLGLFALAAFTAEQRTKEIGIRKSMGASSTSLVVLLSAEFTKLVIIGFIPAAIVGWYASDWWLQGFAYRVAVSPLVFILSGLAAMLIAWVTVGYQSIKASAANPVNSLRYE